MVASSGVQDVYFVLSGTHQLDVPTFELIFTLEIQSSTVHFKRHRVIHIASDFME